MSCRTRLCKSSFQLPPLNSLCPFWNWLCHISTAIHGNIIMCPPTRATKQQENTRENSDSLWWRQLPEHYSSDTFT
uniref:Uncharacterized protein n=1 Tax=Strigamia maritima TaxID=126957 RepID=T1JM93_STRMM